MHGGELHERPAELRRVTGLRLVIGSPLRLDLLRCIVPVDGDLAEDDGLRREQVGAEEAGLDEGDLDTERLDLLRDGKGRALRRRTSRRRTPGRSGSRSRRPSRRC
jgi:hypothetical protein